MAQSNDPPACSRLHENNKGLVEVGTKIAVTKQVVKLDHTVRRSAIRDRRQPCLHELFINVSNYAGFANPNN